MSSVVELILLASSSKNSERCIAGIDRKTGNWIRPVGSAGHGEVPFSLRKIDGKEPEILDIVEMTLDDTAETYGFQMENRKIMSVPWRKVGKATAQDMVRYCCTDEHVFFDSRCEVKHTDLVKDPARHSSLQLWMVDDLSCHEDHSMSGKKRWKGFFSLLNGDRLALVIKDIDFEQKLNSGYKPQKSNLLLISLGVPFQSQYRSEAYCWKLIATVLEL